MSAAASAPLKATAAAAASTADPGVGGVRFGVAGVQMHVSAFEDNVDHMGAYLRHIRTRFPWVRMVMFSELAPLGPKQHRAEPMPGPTEARLAALARDTGATVLMVTHDPQDALRFADATVLVAEGVAAAPVPTAALFANPPPALRDYLGSTR